MCEGGNTMKRNDTEIRIRDTRKTVLTAVKYAVLIAGALVMMFPFIWMLLTSLKTLPEAISIPPQWMPETPRWENYEYSWNLVPFAMFFRNTIWVGILSVVVTLAFSFWAPTPSASTPSPGVTSVSICSC